MQHVTAYCASPTCRAEITVEVPSTNVLVLRQAIESAGWTIVGMSMYCPRCGKWER